MTFLNFPALVFIDGLKAIVAVVNLSGKATGNTRFFRGYRSEDDLWAASFGNGNCFSGECPLNKPREMSLGLMDVDRS